MTNRAARNARRADPVTRSPQTVDWILVGMCGLVWLVLLGMSVAAIVALVDLGQGFDQPEHRPHTGLLYIVIGVSALIVLAAIPMLVRARRPDSARPAASPGDAPAARGDAARPAARWGVLAGERPAPETGVVRIWLRGTVVLASLIGAALITVAVATYLMAVGADRAAWTCYGVGGFVTVVMPLAPWWYLRQLGGVATKAAKG